jgi:cinnamyl-alcohol dehydrogenase
VAGSTIGGIRETQEMLDLCGEKGITCTTELIPIDYVNTAYERVVRGDVRFR